MPDIYPPMNNTDKPIEIRHLLTDSELTCFVVPGLFSSQECEELVSPGVKSAFQNAVLNYPVYYRNNDRLVVDDDALAQYLFNKIRGYLPHTIEDVQKGTSEKEIWELAELNSRLRLCRYAANQYFNRHLDGIHYRSDTRQSRLTFMVYLNSATMFGGGRTLFYKSKSDTEIWAAYTPVQGDLIIFDHNLWHEGEMLTAGEKYVLRSDILYERTSNPAATGPFSAHLGYIWKLLNFNNEVLISGGRDKSVNVWSKAGVLQQSLKAHNNSILCLEQLDDKTFVSGSRDKRIIAWKKQADGSFVQNGIVATHRSVVLSLRRLSDTQFAAAGGDNATTIWNIDGHQQQLLTGHTGWVWDVIVPEEGYLISCSDDKRIIVWRGESAVATFSEPHAVLTIIFNTGKRQLISGNLNGDITIRNLDANYREEEGTTIHAHNGLVRCLIVINDTYIASGGEDNKVKIWNTETGSCMLEIAHDNFVQSLLVVDNVLFSASYDGTIKQTNLVQIGMEKAGY